MGIIFESLFDIIYLIGVIIIGISIIKNAKDFEHKLFGIMAIVLGCGDAFHLVPRIISIITNDFASHTVSLGIGQMITSVTMTIFYLILFNIFKIRYKKENTKTLDIIVYVLAGLRIILSLLPQNQWTAIEKSYTWGIYRNIPFAILGIIIIVLFINETKHKKEDTYSKMGIAIILSFAFYIPVVLLASVYPLIGVLMMPKTLAYVWIVYLGYVDTKKISKQ